MMDSNEKLQEILQADTDVPSSSTGKQHANTRITSTGFRKLKKRSRPGSVPVLATMSAVSQVKATGLDAEPTAKSSRQDSNVTAADKAKARELVALLLQPSPVAGGSVKGSKCNNNKDRNVKQIGGGGVGIKTSAATDNNTLYDYMNVGELRSLVEGFSRDSFPAWIKEMIESNEGEA